MESFASLKKHFPPRRDAIPIFASLIAVVLISWAYLIDLAMDMDAMLLRMPDMPPPEWTFKYFLLMYLMWAVMMLGMMLPSVSSTVLVYASIVRKARQDGRAIASTGIFITGYVILWTAFSLFATILQWNLQSAGLLTTQMKLSNQTIGAWLILCAGLYQLSPLKEACLSHCRSPVHFISTNWRHGKAGALRLGAHHGLYCVGCCWFLMLLLFFGGVMDLLWIAGLTLYVLVEKLLPSGTKTGTLSGIVLIITGAFLMAS